MSFDPALPPPYPESAPSSFRLRPTAVIAWGVILLVCVALPVLRARHTTATTATQTTQPAAGQSATRPAERGVVDFQTRLLGRYTIGSARLLPGAIEAAKNAVGEASPTPEGRIAMAITAGELSGPDAAIERLQTIDDPDAATFRAFYEAQPRGSPPTTASRPATSPVVVVDDARLTVAPATAPVDLAALRPRFGWFAELAEAHGKPDTDPNRAAVLGAARQTVYAVLGAFTLIALAGLVGFGLFITAIVLLALGKLTFSVERPAGPAHVYVEAFAIYLGGLVLASVVIGLLIKDAGFGTQIVGLGGVALLAALWPLLRGVSWPVLQRDWGIHTGRGVVVEALAGIGGYLAGLPIMFVSLLITVGLMRLAQTDATHPIAQEINIGPVWMLYLVAAVFAPLTEELLFRGALVSHLRAGMGVVMAAVISGVVFAAVHPQGWVAIPVLGSIGAVMALVRQWRGSLIASIAAHALNNGFVITLLVLATR
ncbi:MAG TPA: type II CAAX endopeptidase family protein [Tepidisphaeraceae bacterium]|jgi:hypothetical protein